MTCFSEQPQARHAYELEAGRGLTDFRFGMAWPLPRFLPRACMYENPLSSTCRTPALPVIQYPPHMYTGGGRCAQPDSLARPWRIATCIVNVVAPSEGSSIETHYHVEFFCILINARASAESNYRSNSVPIRR